MACIMIVDDDSQLRAALSVRLRTAGYEVTDADSPQAATQILLSDPPDLIVLDIDMPHFSGLELHECLKFSGRTREIPVIYLSGHSTPVYLQEAFRRGARAFVSKPYEAAHLLATIRGILEAAQVFA